MRLGAILFWLMVWEAVSRVVGREILVASPLRVFSRLLELGGGGAFWLSIAETGARVMRGFFLSVFVGGLMAVVTHYSRVMRHLFRPLLSVIRATPVASLIILALVWLASGQIPSFIVFLMVMPIIWTNLSTGLDHVDSRLLEMATIFKFTASKKFKLIYIPALMPYFVAACTTGIGAAWKSAIAAEVISRPRGAMGTQIYNARIYLETADLFAWTVTVIVMSVFIEKLTVYLLGVFSNRLLKGGAAGAN